MVTIALTLTQKKADRFIRDVDPIIKRLERLAAAVVDARVHFSDDAASNDLLIDLLIQRVPDALLEMHKDCLDAKGRLLLGRSLKGLARQLKADNRRTTPSLTIGKRRAR